MQESSTSWAPGRAIQICLRCELSPAWVERMWCCTIIWSILWPCDLIEGQQIRPPTLIVVGEVAALMPGESAAPGVRATASGVPAAEGAGG